MPEQKIVMTIDKEGVITAKTSGYKGESCIEALDELMDLENTITDLKKTDEFHQKQRLKQSQIASLKGKLK